MKRGLYLLFAVSMLAVFAGGCTPPSSTPVFEFTVQPSSGVFSAAGQTITYTYTVKNPNEEMRVQITDDRFGQPCSAFILRPAGIGGPTEQTCTFTYTTTGADVQAGEIVNTATAAASADNSSCCGTDKTDNKTASARVVLELPELAAYPDTLGSDVLSSGCDHDIAQTSIDVDTGLDWLTSDVQITYTASDGQTSYTCHTSPVSPGVVHCSGIPGDSPGPLEICMQRPSDTSPVCLTVDEFPSWIAGITCEPDWKLNHPGCHSIEEIFFTLDTGFTWLSDEGVSFSATDGDTTYACTVTSTPGRVYCYGPHPDNPGALEFCMQREGDAVPLCEVFTGYPQDVWSVSCIPPTPTDRPGQHAPGSCGSITDIPSCQANSACQWDTSSNKCVSR